MTAATVVLAILIGLIPAAIANHKGHNFARWWVFGAVFFLLALPLSLMLKQSEEARRKCPHCAEWVVREAKVCKHCGRDIPRAPAGWYPNPQGEGMRWWDGSAWTDPPKVAPDMPKGPTLAGGSGEGGASTAG
jgi:hypothetical protein